MKIVNTICMQDHISYPQLIMSHKRIIIIYNILTFNDAIKVTISKHGVVVMVKPAAPGCKSKPIHTW